MSKADQFRQYADEAMRWAFQSKTKNEKEILVDLARTWTQAAVWSERTAGPTMHKPPVVVEGGVPAGV
jgi:hypothetical protein